MSLLRDVIFPDVNAGRYASDSLETLSFWTLRYVGVFSLEDASIVEAVQKTNIVKAEDGQFRGPVDLFDPEVRKCAAFAFDKNFLYSVLFRFVYLTAAKDGENV